MITSAVYLDEDDEKILVSIVPDSRKSAKTLFYLAIKINYENGLVLELSSTEEKRFIPAHRVLCYEFIGK